MAMLTTTAEYDGLGFTGRKKINPRPVTVLGVMLPCDPGLVVIRDGEKEYEVATFQLDPRPEIDLEALLTSQQRKVRELGFLFGAGVGGKRKLLPIEQCPIKEQSHA